MGMIKFIKYWPNKLRRKKIKYVLKIEKDGPSFDG